MNCEQHWEVRISRANCAEHFRPNNCQHGAQIVRHSSTVSLFSDGLQPALPKRSSAIFVLLSNVTCSENRRSRLIQGRHHLWFLHNLHISVLFDTTVLILAVRGMYQFETCKPLFARLIGFVLGFGHFSIKAFGGKTKCNLNQMYLVEILVHSPVSFSSTGWTPPGLCIFCNPVCGVHEWHLWV